MAAEEAEHALYALLGQHDELTARAEALTTARDALDADAQALRVALQQEAEARKQHTADGA